MPDTLGLPQKVQSLLTKLSLVTDAGALTQWFESLLAQSGLSLVCGESAASVQPDRR
ncbi:MAG TPA: hypothetical protein PLB25_06195 [Rhodoferax sp.]|nr:hypothetical protein [Rhodoferax sp.]